MRVELLFPAGQSAIEPAIFHLAAGATMQKPLLHRGRELAFVLDGTVHLEVGGNGADLTTGEAADYQSSIPHRFSNLSQGSGATLLIVDSG